MKILVTGGSGFIGSKLIQALLKKGHEVISLDKKDKVIDVPHIKKDISDEDLVDIDISDIDIIYHTAAQSGGYYSLIHPFVDGMWNCIGTLNVVKLAQKLNVKKFIYTSSMAVYGNQEDAKEDVIPTPISFYGTSKLTGEYYTKILQEHSNISFTIFRLFATYGAGQDLDNKHQGILSIYLEQALKGDTITITGAEDRIRQLVHVSDVVNALLMPLSSTDQDNETYNVLYDDNLSPRIIIDAISHHLGKKLTIKVIDGYVGDQVLITGSNDKLRNTGWNPKIDLNEGIKEFVSALK
ncbi:MAG: NAD-dependent epimerase/dehydratase family protein [Balneola sp.]|nr:NAD-dependent epimerase/dehydratase family protein [Balneola sp.]